MGSSTIFAPPEYEYLSEAIEMENPDEARGSVKELEKEFEEAETVDKKRRIKKAMILATNRAKAQTNRTDISEREVRQFKEIANIYEESYKNMEIRSSNKRGGNKINM